MSLYKSRRRVTNVPSVLKRLMGRCIGPLPRRRRRLVHGRIGHCVHRCKLLTRLVGFLSPSLRHFCVFYGLCCGCLPCAGRALPLSVLRGVSLSGCHVRLTRRNYVALRKRSNRLAPPDATNVDNKRGRFSRLSRLVRVVGRPCRNFLGRGSRVVLRLLHRLEGSPGVGRTFDTRGSHSDLLGVMRGRFGGGITARLNGCVGLGGLLGDGRTFGRRFLGVLMAFLKRDFRADGILRCGRRLLGSIVFRGLRSAFDRLYKRNCHRLRRILSYLFTVLGARAIGGLSNLGAVVPGRLGGFCHNRGRPMSLGIVFTTLLPGCRTFLHGLCCLGRKRRFVSAGNTSN